MDPLTALIIKLSDIERKIDQLQEVMNDLKKAERKIDQLQEVVNDLKKSENDSIDTENLISEEVHWCVKIFRKYFCYA